MKKHGLFAGILLLVLLFSLLTSCNSLSHSSVDNSKINSSSQVTLSLNKSSFSINEEDIYLSIRNNTSREIAYDKHYAIEIRIKDAWYQLADKEREALQQNGDLILGPGASDRMSIHLPILENHLDTGQYRLVKTIGGNPYAVEFQITQ